MGYPGGADRSEGTARARELPTLHCWIRKRMERDLVAVVQEVYVQGVSTRWVDDHRPRARSSQVEESSLPAPRRD